MSAWPKWIVGVVLVPIAALVSLVYSLYWYGASALPQELPRAQHSYSDNVRAMYWASLGGEGPMRVERLDPLKVCWKAYTVIRADTSPLRPSASHSLLSGAARSIAFDPDQRLPTPRRIAAEVAAMIRLSNEWRPEQIADYTLDEAWFGRGARGLRAAAPAYFGVPTNQLTRAETIALVGLMKGPSYYDPMRNHERFKKRYVYLASKLGVDPAHIDPERDLARLKPAATAR